MINVSSFFSPGLGIVLGFIAVIQQGAFLGGLFLLVGSFVVRAAEQAVVPVRNDKDPAEHPPQAETRIAAAELGGRLAGSQARPPPQESGEAHGL